MVGWNTMGTVRTMGARVGGGGNVHGGTIAYQKHATPETIVNSRVQFNSSGQSTLSVRITSHDMPGLALAFVLPALGYVFDKVTKRTQDAGDF